MWDERYRQHGYAFGTEPNDFLRDVSGAIPRGAVLCIGEGPGRNAVFLAGLGLDVTAMDQSAVAMERARELAAARGVSIATEVADLGGYRIAPGAWDGIVSIFVHMPPDLRRRVHRQVVAGLRPGGVFVLEAYTPAQIGQRTGGPSTPGLLVPLADLAADLEGLTLEIGREVERDVIEGALHTGRAAVVQILARRPAGP
jgi:SAM-dependent methyltransferase